MQTKELTYKEKICLYFFKSNKFRCKKAWKSKFTFIDYIKESKNAQGWTYHFLNCNKFAEGTCKGLYNNFLDKSPPEVKFLDYRLPRTFCIKRQGKKIAVLPITKTGRLHSNERKSPEFFERWLARCNAL